MWFRSTRELEPSAALVLVFSGLLGILYLSTVPLTAGLVVDMFGADFNSTMFGFAFASHQFGSFFGAVARCLAHPLRELLPPLIGSYPFIPIECKVDCPALLLTELPAGSWLGGRIFDTTGSYYSMWWACAAVGATAAMLHLPIKPDRLVGGGAKPVAGQPERDEEQAAGADAEKPALGAARP
eukprot:SAG22_NODE_388_length_11295_cov_14.512594_17_plen_183_part_00